MRTFAAIIFLIFLCNGSEAANSAFLDKEIKILSSDASGITIEIDVPDPEIEESTIYNVHGNSISISGYASTNVPGSPMLPIRGIPIALPYGARPSIRILQVDEKSERVADILPAPEFINDDDIADGHESTLQYLQNPSVYRSNQFYPQNNLEEGMRGRMRDVNIMSMLFYPVRYNPVSGSIKRVTRIRFAIDFITSTKLPSVLSNKSPAYKTLFAKTVVNYEQAQKWGQPRRSLSKLSFNFLQEGDDWFKIYTDKAGLFKITGEALQEAGLNLDNIDSQNLRLFNQGNEVAFRIVAEHEGTFAAQDYLEFYAQSFKNDYTTTNIYWLTVSDTPGKRMDIRDGAPTNNAPTLSFGITEMVVEKDFFHVANFPGHTDAEHWFMDSLFAPATQSYQFDLGTIASENIPATFTVRLQGYAANVKVSPDHHTLISLNGQQIYEKYWDGRIGVIDSVSFDHAILRDGMNQLDIIGPADTENPYLDWQLIDFFRLRYWRENSVSKDSLAFTITRNGLHTIQADGFKDAEIFGYDISNPNDPKYVKNLGQDGGQLKFEYTTENSQFLLLSEAFKNQPLKIEKDENSNWREPTHLADYIIITFDDFYDDISDLKSFHEANGLAVKIVKVQDVYDEFGFGMYDKQAIKAFLSHAYNNWSIKPSYVLLVGDASWNPRRLRPELASYGSGDRTDFVPTRLFEASVDQVQATSDSWFACMDGEEDVLPDMMIGRLPARSRIETQYMVQKIINYATRFENGEWQNTASFVADIGEGGTNAFEDSSNAYIKNYIPEDFTANRIYLSELGLQNTRQNIFNAFGQGCLTLNYFGHGAVGLWAKDNIFSTKDVPNLDENVHLPFVYTMSCINGYFADPSPIGISLGEQLLTANSRGALAVFTGSGKAFASILQPLTNKLYETLYAETKPIVGTFTNAGLLNMYATFPSSADHVQFYMLFGDPATRLHYTHAGVSKQYGWFSGAVDLKGTTIPTNTQISAFIDDYLFSSGSINTYDGKFGPLYIPADEALTPEKDGAVEGDSVHFSLMFPNDSLAVLYPFAKWTPGETSNINLFLRGNRVNNDYHVNFYVDQKKVGEQFFDGDPISAGSQILFEVTGTNGYVAIPTILLNNEKIPEHEILHVSGNGPITHQQKFAFSPQDLRDGEYEIRVRDIDQFDAQLESNSFRFTVSSKLSLRDVVNFPNPFKESTKFTFMVHNDAAAEVTVKIYTVAGRLVHDIRTFADVGYNEIEWDGRDAYGDALANGVYFYKIIANDGVDQVEVVQRLIVMR